MSKFVVPIGLLLNDSVPFKFFDSLAAAESWAIKNDGHIVYELIEASRVERTARTIRTVMTTTTSTVTK